MQQPLPRTTSEQRAPHYEDIETLIAVGFLSHSVVVSGVHLSLRSLGPGDLFLLRTRLSGHGQANWRLWTLASSIWMVDGFLLLGEPHAAPFILQTLRKIPKGGQDLLFSIASGLFARQTRAGEGTEAYCYAALSRFRWKSYGGSAPNMHSGIPGQEQLGTNYVQRMWTFYNEIEDLRLEEEAAWEGMKYVASAQSPKGVKKTDTHDRQMRQKELDRRQEVQDRFFYIATGVLDRQGRAPGEKGVVRDPFALKSHEELAQEMYRWTAGIEDDHDRIVNDYKKEVVARYEAEKAAREQRAAEYRKQLDSMPLPARSSPLVGYTQAQLSQILQHRSPGKPGLRTVFEGEGHSDYVYNKYLERTPDTGGLVATSDGRLIQSEQRDLTEQVAGRNVPFEARED